MGHARFEGPHVVVYGLIGWYHLVLPQECVVLAARRWLL